MENTSLIAALEGIYIFIKHFKKIALRLNIMKNVPIKELYLQLHEFLRRHKKYLLHNATIYFCSQENNFGEVF